MNEPAAIFIAAHPDDLAAVAGTFARLKRKGYRLFDICITRGEGGRPPGQGLDTVTVRRKEEEAACALLGAELTMFDEPDGALYARREICEALAARLAEIQPSVAIAHWPFEKPDHSAAFSIAFKALSLAKLNWTTEFYMADVYGTGDMFLPELYVNISDVMNVKTAVSNCYRNQWKDTAAERTIPMAQAAGKLAWCDYAEGFKTAVPLVGTRWNRPAEVGRALLSL